VHHPLEIPCGSIVDETQLNYLLNLTYRPS
jgi:hypothetical protein